MDVVTPCTAARAGWAARLALGAVLVFYFGLLAGFYVPAFQGVDQNGYLLLARRFATQGDAAKRTTDPYEFVSGNSVEARPGVYYGKYPTGYPLLCVAAYKLGGPDAVFLVNPILAWLAVWGMYLLARLMLGDWAGICAALLLATNPLFNHYSMDAGSHAGAICFATGGMYFLWQWSQRGGATNAALAGACSAYAVSVRYTEGLLVLPVLAMVAWRLRRADAVRSAESAAGATTNPPLAPPEEGKAGVIPLLGGARGGWLREPSRRQTVLEFAIMTLAALVAIAPLLWHHWTAYGSPWTSGYALCKEATGFGWKWFKENWWTMLSRMETGGLVLTFPLGVAGLGVLAARDRQKALLLGLWLVPSLLLYSAYYWAPKGEGTGYVRFFLSIFPAIIICALALLIEATPAPRARTVVLGLFVLLVSTTGLRLSLQALDHRIESYCFSQTTAAAVRGALPESAAIFAGEQVLNFLEYYGDYTLYAQQTFERGAIAGHLKVLTSDDPHPFQRQKAQRIADLLGNRNEGQLAQLQRELLGRLTKASRRIALITDAGGLHRWRGRVGDEYRFVPRAAWAELHTNDKGEVRVTDWGLYELLPRTGPPEARELAGLEARADALQERIRLLRADYDERFGDAKTQWNKITALETEQRELREQLRRLKVKAATASKPAPAKPKT